MLERRPTEFWGRIHVQRFSVEFDFPVIFTRDAFDPNNHLFFEILARREPDRRHRVAVFVDSGVLSAMPDLELRIRRYVAAHRSALELAGPIVRVPGGEAAKNDPAVPRNLLQALVDRRIDRQSYAIAIGGGAVLDAVGFAAAIFHRGVRHVRFPTTTLSQDDSGVGVKNAVNAFGLKNLVGTFAPPYAVINDGAFIDRLPPEGKRSGIAEAVKVALIRDRSFFEWIEARASALANFDPHLMDALIEHSAALHMRQIGQGGDPFETGSSRPLDYGHWSAHKLEMLTTNRLGHGEAVAIGIALDAHYSVLAGFLANGEDERIRRLLATLGFRLWDDALASRDKRGRLLVLEGLREFKEHLGGELTVTFLGGIGVGLDQHAVHDDLVERAIGWLAQQAE
jgi:3-dehydroquinate synthase